MQNEYLLSLLGDDFTLLTINADASESLEDGSISIRRVALSIDDNATDMLSERYLGEAASAV